MLHFIQTGSETNRPIVLLHGLCESTEIWEPIMTDLEARFHVTRFDLPGFGKSALNADTDVAEMAALVNGAIDNLNLRRPLIFGHSMGGYVALEIAKQFPTNISGFCLLHSTAAADNDERREKREKQRESIAQYGIKPFITELAGGLFDPEFNNDHIKNEIKEEMMKTSPEGIVNALKALAARADNTELLKTTDLPVQIIAGKNDQIIPLQQLSVQASFPKICKFTVLQHSGHLGFVEEPRKCAALMLDFAEFCFHKSQ